MSNYVFLKLESNLKGTGPILITEERLTIYSLFIAAQGAASTVPPTTGLLLLWDDSSSLDSRSWDKLSLTKFLSGLDTDDAWAAFILVGLPSKQRACSLEDADNLSQGEQQLFGAPNKLMAIDSKGECLSIGLSKITEI